MHLQHLVTITLYCCLLLSWKSWNIEPPGALRACPGVYRDSQVSSRNCNIGVPKGGGVAALLQPPPAKVPTFPR
jgi:hypothetical protein